MASWAEVERLFHVAAKLGSADRAAFVAGIDDEQVQVGVKSLLAAKQPSGDFLIGSVIGEAEEVVQDRRYAPLTGWFRRLNRSVHRPFSRLSR